MFTPSRGCKLGPPYGVMYVSLSLAWSWRTPPPHRDLTLLRDGMMSRDGGGALGLYSVSRFLLP